MGLLNLKFLQKSNLLSKDPIENILHKYGQDLCEYAKGYFSYLVTSGGPLGDDPNTYSLYLLVPEIGYNYQILNLNIRDEKKIAVTYFTLKTEQTETKEVDMNRATRNYQSLDELVKMRLESSLANATYQFFVDQVDLKRESRTQFDENYEGDNITND